MLIDTKTRSATFSSIGSLPAHCAPVLFISLSSLGFTPAQAGMVVAASFIGELAFSALSPFMSVKRKWLSDGRLVGLAMVPGLVAANYNGFIAQLGIWFYVGFLSGYCSQVGILAAAKSATPFRLFAWRLSFALVVAGTVCGLTAIIGKADLMFGLSMACAVVVTLLSLLLGPKDVNFGNDGEPMLNFQQLRSIKPDELASLIAIFIFFVVIVCFLTQIDHFFDDTAEPTEVFLAIALSKAACGMLLFPLAAWISSRGEMFHFSVLVALCLTLAALSDLAILLVGGLFLIVLELLINLGSSSVFARASELCGDAAKSLFLFAILLGSAIGPLVGAASVEIGGVLAVKLVCGTLFFMLLVWHGLSGRRQRANPT